MEYQWKLAQSGVRTRTTARNSPLAVCMSAMAARRISSILGLTLTGDEVFFPNSIVDRLAVEAARAHQVREGLQYDPITGYERMWLRQVQFMFREASKRGLGVVVTKLETAEVN